jgi:hypothetical protein
VGRRAKKAFDEIEKKVVQETLLEFPDFEKEYHVYTDAPNKQLRAVGSSHYAGRKTAGFL